MGKDKKMKRMLLTLIIFALFLTAYADSPVPKSRTITTTQEFAEYLDWHTEYAYGNTQTGWRTIQLDSLGVLIANLSYQNAIYGIRIVDPSGRMLCKKAITLKNKKICVINAIKGKYYIVINKEDTRTGSYTLDIDVIKVKEKYQTAENALPETPAEPDPPIEPEKKRIELTTGTDMISFPLKMPNGTKITDLKTNCNIKGIVYWNPEATTEPISTKYQYYMKKPTKSYHKPLNELEIKTGQGYFIKTLNNCYIEIEGESFDTNKIHLKIGTPDWKGWNMFGVSKTSKLKDIKGNCNISDSIWGYDKSTKSYKLATILEPFKAYWAKTTNNCVMGD